MIRGDQIQIRAPYVLVEDSVYYLFGTTDVDPWSGRGTSFLCYRSSNLEWFEGPFVAFAPAPLHKDYIEISGQRCSLFIEYGIDEKRSLQLEQTLVFPCLTRGNPILSANTAGFSGIIRLKMDGDTAQHRKPKRSSQTVKWDWHVPGWIIPISLHCAIHSFMMWNGRRMACTLMTAILCLARIEQEDYAMR